MIQVENLTKYYHTLCAVDQINFEIQKGEILGLLGPNGAGKTTTLRMLTGYLHPSSGDIHVKGYRIDKHTLEIKKILGYLPESAPLYHDMLVFDYLNYVAAIRQIDGSKKSERIRHLADLCGINEVMHRPQALIPTRLLKFEKSSRHSAKKKRSSCQHTFSVRQKLPATVLSSSARAKL